jgi:hypothetical protein
MTQGKPIEGALSSFTTASCAFRSRLLRVPPLALVTASLTTLVAACVYPDQDYEDFVERTETVRGVDPERDAAVVDAAPAKLPAESFQSPFFFACLASAFKDKATKALLFRTDLTFTRDGNAGKLQMKNVTSLKVAAATAAETAGTPFDTPEVPVTEDAGFTITLGNLTIKGEANSISGRDIETENMKLSLGQLLSSDAACMELDGKITKPLPVSLGDGNGTKYTDICIMRRLPDPSAALPTFTLDDFRCP